MPAAHSMSTSDTNWSTLVCFFFFSSRRRHTRYIGDWSSDVCSSDLVLLGRITDGACREDLGRAARAVGYPAVLKTRRLRSEERRVGKEGRSRWRAGEQIKSQDRAHGAQDERATVSRSHESDPINRTI